MSYLEDIRLTKSFLNLLTQKFGATHFRTIPPSRFSNSPIGIAYNLDNPPNDSEANDILEHLDGLVLIGALKYRKRFISTVTTHGPVATFFLEISNINPGLLRQIVRQEELHGNDHQLFDSRVWNKLPYLIKAYWEYLNSDVQKHVLKCMDEFLEKHPHYRSNNVFSDRSPRDPRDYPNFPVKLWTSKSGYTEENHDLMLVLGSPDISKTDFKQLIPASNANEIRFRSNTTTPASKRI